MEFFNTDYLLESDINSRLPQELYDFNNKLNKYDYAIITSSGVIKNPSGNDFRQYRTIPVDIFAKEHAGVCWDFVNYEYMWFTTHRYKTKCFFIMIDNNNDCPTHTFILIYYKHKVYWFESSWYAQQGIHEYDTEKEAITDIVKLHREFSKKKSRILPSHKTYIFEYETNGLDKNLTAMEYINKVTSYKEIDNIVIESGLRSSVDGNFKPKNELKLSSFRKELITQIGIDKYKDNYKYLKHLRISKNTKGYFYTDKNNNIVCTIMVETKDTGDKWIQALEISKPYQSHGLSKQLLDIATKELGAKYLSVRKDNKLASSIYSKYGFKIYDETDSMRMMKLNK